mgnify:CR=1 FL=1
MENTLTSLTHTLARLARGSSPFAPGTNIEGQPHWVRPQLVAEVSFGDWTAAGRLRHAVFQGLRSDIDARRVVRETAMKTDASTARPRSTAAAPTSLLQRARVTHPERVVDASTGATKIDLVRYYDLVGELMMKHLARRPLALVRAPAGVAGELFFQKHGETGKLPGLRQVDSDPVPGKAPMFEVTGARGLLSAAQWNVLELHTLNAVTSALDQPDRLVFDLDPGEGVPWPQVRS